jgi:hypothetical protein
MAASVLVFCLSPIYSLVVYIAALVWYPSYLSVQVGTVDFTVQRIVILAIFVKLFLQTDLAGRFKFIWLDKIIIIYFIAQVISGATTAHSLMAFLENRAGVMFDMVLPYFAVRMIIHDKRRYLFLLKAILVITAPLAMVGFYQCLTGNNPFGFLKKYYAWMSVASYQPVSRDGFYRADVVFSHSIMYGLFFAMLGPVCAGILHIDGKNRTFYFVGLLLMCVGVFSSMSSGPWLATLLAVCFIALYSYRRYWKVALVTIILMCVTVEIISNRHFYEVIDRFTFSGQTAWYRSRLIEVALYEDGMSGHWLTGYGYDVDPGWGPKIDGRNFTDTVNHYLLVLQSYGLVGLLPFLAMNIAVIKRLINAYKASISNSDRWLVWCLSAGLFGLAGALMSVSLFGQLFTIYYMMIGFAGVMPAITAKSSSFAAIEIDSKLIPHRALI